MMLLEKIILYITVQPWKINLPMVLVLAGLLVAQPFLYIKKLGNHTYRIATDNPRLTAVRCQLKSDSDIIIGSVYMPFNDNSVRHYDDFLSVIGVMQGLVNKFYSCNFILEETLTPPNCQLPEHMTF